MSSHDFLLLKLSNPNASARTLSQEDCTPLGSFDELRRLLESDIYSIGVIGTTEPEALQLLQSLCDRHGWIAYDLQTADFASFTPAPAKR